MGGQAEVSCFRSAQMQAIETLPEKKKKKYRGDPGHSTQNLPFIRQAIFKNYEP